MRKAVGSLMDFYPRSPCGERLHGCYSLRHSAQFLSTLSLRRATSMKVRMICTGKNFYPRSPCGERPSRAKTTDMTQRYFYPRSPCGERLDKRCQFNGDNGFLSTLSLRRATQVFQRIAKPFRISIHALLAESDFVVTAFPGSADKFLSTLSLRRATAKVHKTVGHFCAYETNFMGIASSC